MTHLKPRSATVVLYQGDDMDRLADLQRRVSVAERIAAANTGNARMDDAPADGEDSIPLSAAKAEFDAFVDEAAERALSIKICTIGREFFRDLVAEHPPRMVKRKVTAERAMGEDEAPTIEAADEVEHEEDEGWGINVATFPLALLTFRKVDEEGEEPETIATITEPEFKTEAKVKRFVNRELSDGDFDRLWQAAYVLNRTPTQDPKAFVHSLSAFRSTDET